MSVFSLLAFSGGVASEVPASSSAAKPLLEAAARLESTVDNRLRGIDERVAVLAAARPGSIPTGTAELTASISALRLDLQAIHSTSEAAATQSAKAANKSTGWGWHLVIVVLLLGVLLVLFAALERK